MAKNQTPLTLEVFQEILIPQIKLLISETVDEKLEQKLEEKLEEKLNDKLSFFPTREEYYAREDKTMKELQSLRKEVAVTNHLYQKTNKWVDKIDKHLGIGTSTVF